MKEYHADEAIERFRKCFDEAELDYSIADSSDELVRMTVRRSGISLTTWFDVNQQQWGFDLLQGGHKTCDKFEEFEDFFGTYLSLHTVFIPNAKIIADAFEREIGITTVYDSFSGNKQRGYSAKFKVLGSDQNVLISRITEGYLARLVIPDEATQKFKVKAEYKFEFDDDGKVRAIPTIHLYTKRLKDRYSNDSTKQIQRVGEYLFCFSIEGLVITAEISFNYMEVRYHITEVNDYDADISLSPEDPYNLSEVYMACKDFYDDCVAGEEDAEQSGGSPEQTSDDSDVWGVSEEKHDEESFDGDFEAEEPDSEEEPEPEQEPEVEEEVTEAAPYDYQTSVAHEDVESLRQEEKDAVEASAAPFEDDATEEQSDESAQQEVPVFDPDKYGVPDTKPITQEDKFMVVESIKMVMEDDKKVGVQFIVDGKVYIFGVAMVKSVGFPIKRIDATVGLIVKSGMKMTEDEVRLKRYAEDPDNVLDTLEKIVDAVFA